MDKIIIITVSLALALLAMYGVVRGYVGERYANPPIAINVQLNSAECQRQYYAVPETSKISIQNHEAAVYKFKRENPAAKPVKIEDCLVSTVGVNR